MPMTHEFLKTAPFDLYKLSLFQLVVELGSFTKAGKRVGLTQSAMTRQIQVMEMRLGVPLLERTTRRVQPTGAGRFLLEQSGRILGEVSHSIQRLKEDFTLAPKQVRVGVARSIGLAYLPGFFTAYQRKNPHVSLEVSHQTSAAILAALEARELDVGLLCPPAKLPASLEITHRFSDDFTLIVPTTLPWPDGGGGGTPVSPTTLKEGLRGQRWLLLDRKSNTGRQLREWLEEAGLPIRPAMELDSFDLIVNLVSLGLGVSLVPHRVLPLYLRQRKVRRVPLHPRFSRELVVVTLRERIPREHIAQFAKSVLF